MNKSYLFITILILVIITAISIAVSLYKKRYSKPIIEDFGFDYDREQDIFYSDINAWQRKFGYCRLYDEAAAPLSVIVDCEPIRFEYGGKKWLIELWKGQYGMLTGGEVGVYSTDADNIDFVIPGIFDGTFYGNTDDENHLKITFTLKKDGKMLFARDGKHWWLTGFVLGEFSEPGSLTMNTKIVLKDNEMCDSFVEALKKLGYTSDNMYVYQNSVFIWFSKAYSPKPLTRTDVTDAIIQQKNKAACDLYRSVTGEFENSLDKLGYIKKDNKKIYKYMLKTGRTKKIYSGYKKIQKQL